MKNIAVITLFASICLMSTAHAENLNLKVDRACAYPDDRVIDQVEFMISTHSNDLLKQDSPLMKITPGFCMKEAKRSLYNMNIYFDTLTKPLEIQIGERFLLNVFKLSFQKIIIGSTEQLARVDCRDEDHTCINVDELKGEGKKASIQTKAGLFEFNLSL